MENTDRGAAVTLSAASASGDSEQLDNLHWRGAQIGVNITAITGTSPSITVIVEGFDAASGQYYTLLSSAALTATGFTLLTVYPGVTAAANGAAATVLPEVWRIRYTIAGTTPAITETIGANLIR